MPRFAGWLLAGLVCFSMPAVTKAADEKAKPAAITDISKVGEEFAYQGEYLGSVVNACRRCEPVGLQVVSLGKGDFQAVEYRGGLPGYGWPMNGERTKYTGKLEGSTLTLNAEGRQIVIANGAASVTSNGWSLGNAAKVTRQSPTLGQTAPWGAKVLFDGTNADHFKDGKLEGNLLKEGCETKEAFGDFQLHIEYMLPYMPLARGQARGNSGVYIQSRYEVQVLDSFGLDGIENECGSLYKQRRPDLNMCLPPLTWQTYDIWFFSPRFDESGKKIQNAQITVLHNGVAVHNQVEVTAKTGGGAQEGPKALVTKLQNHGDPVRFRNIWIVPYAQQTTCPVSIAAAN